MKLALLAGLLMSLGLAGILTCTILQVHESVNNERVDYGVLLDAGSTSTKAYIFQWRHKTTKNIPFVTLAMSKHGSMHTKQIHPGIATLAPNFTAVSDYLEPLLEWAQDKIPDDALSATPIFLQGTGGLRQLPSFDSSILLTTVKYTLQKSGFYFENSFVDILTGKEEAGYGFVAVNALYDRFGSTDSPLPTYGSLDMGGVSAEIAFKPTQPPPFNYSYTTNINGTDYSIYVQSNDGLGVNAARHAFNISLFQKSPNSLVMDPCVPLGYNQNVTTWVGGNLQTFTLMGTSDYGSCKANVASFVQGLTSSLPKPPSTGTFVVADKYIKVKDFFKLKDNANVVELSLKLSSFCSLSLIKAQEKHPNTQDVQDYCFMGAYIASLLTDFYQISPTMRHLLWKNKMHGMPVSWTLGSMVDYTSRLTPDTSDPITYHHVRFFHTDAGLVTLFISILVFVLGVVLFILQQRRPSDYVLIRE